MDSRLRRGYLDAMGVRVWRLRHPPATGALPDATGVPLPSTPPPAAPVTFPERPEPPAVAVQPAATAPATAGATVRARGVVTPAVGEMTWEELAAAVAGCRACGLCETRTRTVFGVGDRGADLMVIGEAPGADEDRQGEPFVGRAGQLLNLMLAAIGLPRERVYIANVLKCRPPGNRDPRPEESLRCEGFLVRQIALVQPRVILSVGRISAQHLLRSEKAIGDLRGRWHALGPAGAPLMVTYHPAYLLRSPEAKAKTWSDLQQVVRRLRGQPT